MYLQSSYLIISCKILYFVETTIYIDIHFNVVIWSCFDKNIINNENIYIYIYIYMCVYYCTAGEHTKRTMKIKY